MLTTILSSLAPLIITAITIIIGLLIFRRPINDFIHSLKRANLPYGISLEGDVQRARTAVNAAVDEFKETVEELEKLNSGKKYLNYKRAFVDAEEYVLNYLKEHNNADDVVEIRILAVGMTYSWKDFVEDIPQLVEQTSGCRVDLKILFVNPVFLEDLKLNHKDNEVWFEESQKRKIDAEKFIEKVERFGGRITITTKSYNNLPFWHGILINNEHLFIGRTDWDLQGKRPLLSVGQNEYRYYLKKEDNDKRVSRFEHWHRYYFKFNSVLVATNISTSKSQQINARNHDD